VHWTFWIWCILCICNTFSCVEHNFIRKNWKSEIRQRQIHIRRRRIWGCAHSVHTYNSSLCSFESVQCRQDMIYCMYRMYFMYLQQTFLCRPQLNSRKLYASHMWLIPNTQVDIHSNVFMGHWDMVYCVYTMYLVYMQQLLLCRLQLNLRQLQDSCIDFYLTLHLLFFQSVHWTLGHDVFSVYSTQVLVQREISFERIERESISAAPNLRLCTFGSYPQFSFYSSKSV